MQSTELNNKQGYDIETRVALSSSMFAVFLAISSILGGMVGDDEMITRGKVNNEWSRFQAKSIKENLVEAHIQDIKLQQLSNPDNKIFQIEATKTVDSETSEIKRYEIEKKEIKANAEKLEKLAEKFADIGDRYDLADALYQISLVLAAITLVAKKDGLWYVSLALGVAAIGVTSYAYLNTPAA